MSDSKASNHERVVNVEIEAEGVRKLPESLGASVKVVFESPTLLKDFPALLEAVLLTPIYMLLADICKLRQCYT